MNQEAAGIYGLALNLSYILPILIISLKLVLLPEASRLKEVHQFERYLKSTLKISLAIIGLFIPLLFLSKPLILFFFGRRYSEAVAVFNWLLFSHFFVAVGSPIRSALYSMDKPHILSGVDFIRAAAVALGCYFLIPPFGLLVPAVLNLIVNSGALAFVFIYVLRHVRRGKRGLWKGEFSPPPI